MEGALHNRGSVMSHFYLVKQTDGYFIIENENGEVATREFLETLKRYDAMKMTIKHKRPYRKMHRLGKGLAVATVATISFASLSGCEFEEGNGSQFSIDPLNPTEATVVITTTDKEGNIITVTPTPSATKNVEGSAQSGENTTAAKDTPTPKPSGSSTNNPSNTPRVTQIPGGTTVPDTSSPTTKPTVNNNSNAQSSNPTGQSNTGNGGTNVNNNTPTPKPTDNTSSDPEPDPTEAPKPTPNPYTTSCSCPECSGDVSYRSARTVHHDAETHDETTSSYDGIVRTYRYTIGWTDSFINWCADNGIAVPEAPSRVANVYFDSDGNVTDTSEEDAAISDIADDAYDLVLSVGSSGIEFSYVVDQIGEDYIGYTETTTTIIDEPAWDENIPAGWYCDDCDYYSASVPRAYDDIDI